MSSFGDGTDSPVSLRRRESELRYTGTFSELLYFDQEIEFHRDESYEDIMQADGETC